MAFVTISGYPSSGKSRRATQVHEYLLSKLQDPSYEGPFRTIEIISDDTLGLERMVYDGVQSRVSNRNFTKCMNRKLL